MSLNLSNIFSIIEWDDGAEVFENFVSCKDAYSDIMKETISQGRKSRDIEVSHALLLALQNSFCRQNGESNPSNLAAVKDLARKMTLTFGFDLKKRTESLTRMLKDGTDFAFREETDGSQNIQFLEVLSEFSHKLSREFRSGRDINNIILDI